MALLGCFFYELFCFVAIRAPANCGDTPFSSSLDPQLAALFFFGFGAFAFVFPSLFYNLFAGEPSPPRFADPELAPRAVDPARFFPLTREPSDPGTTSNPD